MLEQAFPLAKTSLELSGSSQVHAIKQQIDSLEFDIKTLTNGRLDKHEKSIDDLSKRMQVQNHSGDDQVLRKVPLHLHRVDKASVPEKTSSLAGLSTTDLARALLDRLQSGDSISDKKLVQVVHLALGSQGKENTSTSPAHLLNPPPSDREPIRPDLPEQERAQLRSSSETTAREGQMIDAPQIQAKRKQKSAPRGARAGKRKSASKGGEALVTARFAKGSTSKPSMSQVSADKSAEDEEGFHEDQPRRSSRAPKPAQMAAGTISWAEAKAIKNWRLGSA